MSDPATPTGLYLVDKPAGPTSHDIVAAVRRQLPRRTKVGHAGTLDPFATGLLVVAIGGAARLIRWVTDHDKSYRARVRLGARSVTGDPEGPITPSSAPLPTAAQVRDAVAALPGTHPQRVPAYSAVKVDGERLYRQARRGVAVETPERLVTIRSAEVVAADPAGTWFDLQVTCSKGTYIRQLAVDLGESLGAGAYCERLCRTAIGSLLVDDAVAPDEVPQRGRVATTAALAPMPTWSLSDDEARAIAHGRSIAADADGTLALVQDDEVVAIAEADGAGSLRPIVVLA